MRAVGISTYMFIFKKKNKYQLFSAELNGIYSATEL